MSSLHRWVWELEPWNIGGVQHKQEAQQGGFHQLTQSHWRSFSGNTYLTLYLQYLGLTLKMGEKGRAAAGQQISKLSNQKKI